MNGKVNRHICAFCLTLGKQLNHSEKNCNTKANNPKNEQAVTTGVTCEPTVVTKVSSELNHNDNHSNVTVKANTKCVIDNNVKRSRFVYNSGVNPMCIEALTAKQSPRGRAAKCTTPVVHGRTFVASGSAVHVSNPSKGYVKPNVNPGGRG